MANIEHQSKERLDYWLMRNYPDFSRAFLQKLCTQEKVLVDGEPQKSGYKLRGNEKIEILHDMANSLAFVPDIDLPIVYEDENVIVINKPAGVLSHGLSKFLGEPSVASFLRQRLKLDNAKTIKDTPWKPEDLRFGIVHRLDRVTSGIMICAKNQDTMRMLQKQFHDRNVKKVYRAIVQGHMKLPEALLDLPLERNPKAPATWRVGPNGKSAQTQYKVLKEADLYSEIELLPRSGRTHQLRVHLQHTGHPIVGDVLYKGKKAERLYLHAYQLTIELPGVGTKTFTAPIPNDFEQLLESE
jgi:23S rRNA pseudouridine1911/1915/1917 synthase